LAAVLAAGFFIMDKSLHDVTLPLMQNVLINTVELNAGAFCSRMVWLIIYS
jgi:hypothetical protein